MAEMYCILCEENTEHEVLDHCICNEDQGAGYTYQDEFGQCYFCTGEPARCTECNSTRSI